MREVLSSNFPFQFRGPLPQPTCWQIGDGVAESFLLQSGVH